MNVEGPTELHVLKTNLVFPESPRWRDGRLWVSDWGAQEVLAVDLEGRSDVAARVEGLMCIAHLPDGRLLAVSSTRRRLLRREPDGSLVTHGDLGALGGQPWNDLIVDGRGNAYVNNIGFDFLAGEFAPGFVALVIPDGSARQVADGLAFPRAWRCAASVRDRPLGAVPASGGLVAGGLEGFGHAVVLAGLPHDRVTV